MNLDPEKLKEILVSQNYIKKEDIEKAGALNLSSLQSIQNFLLSKNLITKDLLGQAIAEFYKVPYADLNSSEPPRDQILKIPEELARKFRAVLFKEEGNSVTVSTDDPTREGLMPELQTVLKDKEIKLAFSLSEDIDPIFVFYLKPLETRFAAIIEKEKRVAPEILEQIFGDAVAFRASDIHFEPHEKEIVIRFRVDGVLHEAGRIAKEFYDNILNRVKVSAHMRTDEHFSAQDGSLRHDLEGGKSIAMRVSVIPTLDGEKVEIRLLSEYVKRFSLEDLGLAHQDYTMLTEVAKKPFGMILVTGPTGSGKTTTLYALLNILNNPEVNITTIEDPVEYKITTINQIQVDPKTNLTFAQGLKSILRQDPDIILVGEIRDLETAEIAVNAALTGHLLLSTFHANDAATAIPRMLEIGIEPFLVSSTMELIISQRLVRRICESCRVSAEVGVDSMQRFFPQADIYFPKGTAVLYMGKGCNTCHKTGYRGRVAIFEFIRMTPEMQDIVLKHPSTKQIWELARSQGGHSLFEDGMEKVKNGITTIEELIRVAPPDDNE